MTTMLADEEIIKATLSVRRAKAKYQNIVSSHTEWDDYCLTDKLDDEYCPSDMVGEVYDADLDELQEVNNANVRAFAKNIESLKKASKEI